MANAGYSSPRVVSSLHFVRRFSEGPGIYCIVGLLGLGLMAIIGYVVDKTIAVSFSIL